MPTYKFAPNLPVRVELGYIDIVPSDKGGPQVRLKGTIDGAEKTFAYLPGKLADQLTTLISAGIIGNKEYPMEVDGPFEVKPLKKSFTMMKEQLAGDKYGTFKVVNGNGGTSAATASGAGSSSSVGSGAGAAPHPPKSYTDIYIKATDFVIEKIVPKYKAAGFTLTGTDVKEMVACVFIPKSKE